MKLTIFAAPSKCRPVRPAPPHPRRYATGKNGKDIMMEKTMTKKTKTMTIMAIMIMIMMMLMTMSMMMMTILSLSLELPLLLRLRHQLVLK